VSRVLGMTVRSPRPEPAPVRPRAPEGDTPEVVLQLVGVGKTFGEGARAARAVQQVDVTVGQHEFVGVVGPSGCGKTTILRCAAGLLAPSDGQVLLRGEPVTTPPPGLAVVFQDYSRSLLPWMKVVDNVALPLRHQRAITKEQRARRVAQALDAVGLGSFGERYPWQLSGGMQQRVAIARALAYQPELVLMDEPFASVDAQTREELEDLLLQIRDRFGLTMLVVTHDMDEAVYLCDRVVVLSAPPSVVRDVVEVNLPRPRHQVTTKALPAFAELRARVWTGLRRDEPDPSAPPAAPQSSTPSTSAASLETAPPAAEAVGHTEGGAKP